jgi:polysaccharide export outer membrane protein
LTIPLLGAVAVVGLSSKQVELRVGALLKSRGLVRDPQITVTVLQFRSKQISVLGHVNRPGRYALEEGAYNLTDILALAGGTSPDASDTVTLVRRRDDKTITLEVNIPQLFRSNGSLMSPEVIGGDTVFVDRYPFFYIYGEVQRPGVYRLENKLSVMQALSLGGGFTLRAAKGSIQINRRDPAGKLGSFIAQYGDLVLPDDVVFIKESLF